MTDNNACVECGRDTSIGSGLYVDRLLVVDDEGSRFCCVECRSEECDFCHEMCHEYDLVWQDGTPNIKCSECQ